MSAQPDTLALGQLAQVTIMGLPVRLYHHPTVPFGRPWCSLSDMAAVAGYPSSMAQDVAARWRSIYPHLSETGVDGAIAVSDAAVTGLLSWLGELGLENAPAIRDIYDEETGRIFLALGARLESQEWRNAVQRSALADALPDPNRRTS